MKWFFATRTRAETTGAVLALFVSILCTFALTWPTVQHWDVVVLGGGELGGWLWRYDWHFRSLDGLMLTDAGPWELWREFVSLGRYPETGNILDVLAISYPLEKLFGFPASYNLKIFAILVLNGVSAYALGRYFSGSIAASIAASALAIANPLTIQEIQACGLRQAVLWWVLLYPALLDRALRRRTLPAGILAGACFGTAAAWYWFYGLFTGIFTVLWLIKHAGSERIKGNVAGLARSLAGLGLGLALAAGPFILPYALPGGGDNKGGASALPEMTFFLPYPPFDVVSHAPLRPATYAENILASIHRTINSSWTATYPFNPTLNESLSLAVVILGILPALYWRRTWGWLLIWLFFYFGTLGPFLRLSGGDASNVTRVMGDYVVRLPYVLMFQFIPGMSRMFAPYRLGAYVIVCSVALLAIGISRFRWRAWMAPFVIAAIVAQPMYRWGRGAVNEGDADGREFRSPVKINRIVVPQFYKDLDKERLFGIIEVPIDQQQDLLYYYQVVHGQKVYKSWASPAAIPPLLRPKGAGGPVGERLRFMARGENWNGPVPEALQALSRDPSGADLAVLGTPELQRWGKALRYELLIIHERGYYLVDPLQGKTMYETAVQRVTEAMGVQPETIEELHKGDPLNPEVGVPIVGDLVPWSSQPMNLPPQKAPAAYRMAVYKLPVPVATGEEEEAVEEGPDPFNPEAVPGGDASATPTPEPHEHAEVTHSAAAPGAPLPGQEGTAAPQPSGGGTPTPTPAPPGAPGGAPAPAGAPGGGTPTDAPTPAPAEAGATGGQ